MNVTTADYEGFDQLHNMCSDAFGDISRKVEADSDNGIDDDGDWHWGLRNRSSPMSNSPILSYVTLYFIDLIARFGR